MPTSSQSTLPNFDDLWDYDQPATTQAQFCALLPRAEQAGDLSYLIQLLTQIARTESLQRQFEAAHQTLDRAEALLTDDLDQARIRCLLERGRTWNSSKQSEQARPLFLAAWNLARAQGEDFYAIDAAHMLGIIEPPTAGLEWNLQALDLAEHTADQRSKKWLGSLCNNIGWTYHERGEYQQALALFQKALVWRETQGQPKEIRIARWCVARALRSLGRTEEALEIHQHLLRDYQGVGETDGYIYEELGECLHALNRQAEAQPYFALAAFELAKDPWLPTDEPARLQRLRELGGVPL